eukprot:3235226-Rhodomonas_salina.1
MVDTAQATIDAALAGTDVGYGAIRLSCQSWSCGRERRRRQNARQRPTRSGCRKSWTRTRWDAASVYGDRAAVYGGNDVAAVYGSNAAVAAVYGSNAAVFRGRGVTWAGCGRRRRSSGGSASSCWGSSPTRSSPSTPPSYRPTRALCDAR